MVAAKRIKRRRPNMSIMMKKPTKQKKLNKSLQPLKKAMSITTKRRINPKWRLLLHQRLLLLPQPMQITNTMTRKRISLRLKQLLPLPQLQLLLKLMEVTSTMMKKMRKLKRLWKYPRRPNLQNRMLNLQLQRQLHRQMLSTSTTMRKRRNLQNH
jgi:hypothetical protein